MASQRNTPISQENRTAILPFDKLTSALKLAKSDVVHAFILGSRLWGTNNANSDYDAYVVVKDDSSYASGLPNSKGFVSVHSGNVDALILVESVYHDRLRSCTILDLVTLWLPEEFIVFRSPLPAWKRDDEALEAAVRTVLDRDVLMAQKHMEAGNAPKSKKVLIHTLRMIMMGTQILTHGKVTDWACANDLFSYLRDSYHLTSWQTIADEIFPIKNEELAKLEQARASNR